MEAAASRVLRVGIRVYLVVVDIRIVDCHMYPGEPCPPSHVLSYIPAKASMQYIHPLYTILFPPTVMNRINMFQLLAKTELKFARICMQHFEGLCYCCTRMQALC